MNELETMLCNLLHCDRSGLYVKGERLFLTATQEKRLHSILKNRLKGRPLQYLLGDADFMGLKLKVAPGVLVPRPETEILVEEAVARLSVVRKSLRILDMGTGSGNIAIGLAKFLKDATIMAVDISAAALKIAAKNASLNGVARKIAFVRGDLFGCLKAADQFDVIVSNPPYVSEDEYARLPEDVLCEPREALVAADGGYDFYRRIEKGSRRHLASRGMLFLEIGDRQAKGVKKIFSDARAWKDVSFVKDLAARDRVAVIERR